MATQRSRFDCATVFFSPVFSPLVSSRSDFDKMTDSWQPSRPTYGDVPTCTCKKLVRQAKIYKWKANGEFHDRLGELRRKGWGSSPILALYCPFQLPDIWWSLPVVYADGKNTACRRDVHTCTCNMNLERKRGVLVHHRLTLKPPKKPIPPFVFKPESS